MRIVRSKEARGVRLSDLARLPVRADWNEVLGGGLLEGSIVLVSGAPGSGKTSDMLALASMGGSYDRPSLYVTSEWHPNMLAARARELSLVSSNIVCVRADTIDQADEEIALSSARVIVLDSWGALVPIPEPEGLDRVRASIGSATLLVVLHATKDGDFSGEEKLLHKADALVWVEPEKLRTIKNWHGPPEVEIERLPASFRGSAETWPTTTSKDRAGADMVRFRPAKKKCSA
jgi:DNA repair protein RadA/Sms